MNTIRRILVATDLSDTSNQAYWHAAGIALRAGASITLLHVDEVSGFPFPASPSVELVLRQIAKRRAELLGQAKASLEQAAATAVLETTGDPAEQISEHVRTHDVDLLVVGKRGPNEPSRLMLGRTVKRLLRRAEVPTLVVPHCKDARPNGPVAYRRILVATDLGETSQRGIRAALSFAELVDAQMECLHVIRMPVLHFIEAEWPMLVPHESRDELTYTLGQDLSVIVGRMGSERCTGSVSIGHSISGALVSAAEECGADLIAMSMHGMGRHGHIGTTTENVLKRSGLPVLVFPNSVHAEGSG